MKFESENMPDATNKDELYLYKGKFLFIAAVMTEAIAENKELVNEYRMSCGDSTLENKAREAVFKTMMNKGKGRFNPVEIKEYISWELSSHC